MQDSSEIRQTTFEYILIFESLIIKSSAFGSVSPVDFIRYVMAIDHMSLFQGTIHSTKRGVLPI